MENKRIKLFFLFLSVVCVYVYFGKDTLLQRFLTHGLKKQNVATKSVTSTDGTLTIPQTNNCARKPGQRKRVRNILIYTNTQNRFGSNVLLF
jgi:hypothetical protein